MADETIRITVNDDSDGTSLPNEVLSQGSTLDATSSSIQKTIDDLRRLSESQQRFDADLKGIEGAQAELDIFAESTRRANEGLTSYSDSIESAQNELDQLGNSLSTTVDGMQTYATRQDALNAQLANANRSLEELEAEAEALAEAHNQLADEVEDSEEEFNGLFSGINKSVEQFTRQVSNFARASGAITSSQDQMVTTGIRLLKNMSRLSAVAAGVVISFAALISLGKQADKVAEDLADKVLGFSSEATIATVNKRLREIEDQIKLADQGGDEIAALQDATSEFNSELRVLQRQLIDLFGDKLAAIVEGLATAVGLLSDGIAILKFLNDIGNIPNLIRELLVMGGIIEGEAKATTEFLETINRKMKDPEEDELLRKFNRDIAELFNPANVGIRDKKELKALQEKFDELIGPPAT